MNGNVLLLLNLALAFYSVGTIWAHEVDIFRSWKLLDPVTFRRVQTVHWRKLPYWVFAPLAFMLGGSIALLSVHPAGSSPCFGWIALGVQSASHFLTAILWGPWQAGLSRDDRGAAGPYLRRILATHWIRTLLINVYGLILLMWAIHSLG